VSIQSSLYDKIIYPAIIFGYFWIMLFEVVCGECDR